MVHGLHRPAAGAVSGRHRRIGLGGTMIDVLVTGAACKMGGLSAATIAAQDDLRAKNHLKGTLVLSMESPSSRMQTLGRAVLMEMPVLTVDEVLERIDAVTHDDVMAAVRRYYDPKKWSTVCIGPRPEPFRAVTEGFAWEER